jgi:cytochrome P450
MEQVAAKPLVDPPLLPGRPVVGSMLELSRDRLAFARRLWDLGGVVRFRMFNMQIYHVSDPQGVQRILQDNARNYIKGPLFDTMRNLVGNGLFLSNGDFWLRQRRLMQPAFHQRRLAALVDGMALEAQVSIDRWAQAAADGQVLNMAEETTALAMRVVTRALFSAGLQGAEKRLADAITTIIDEISFRFEMPFYPPLSVPTPRNRRTREAMRVLDNEVYAIIARRRAEAAARDDLLAMLMEARDEGDGQGMSDQQLRDEVLIMFAAGHETTANAMAWAFYELQQQPAVLAHLRAEVAEVLGERAPSAEDLPRLVYTRQVIDETLRLYPPVFLTNRQALQEDEICGYHIPAGALLSVSPYAAQHDPRYWNNPMAFDPDRFSPERSAGRPRYAYFPFGGGPRQCIGKDFALYEAAVVLAMAVARFDWELAPGEQVRPAIRATFRPSSVRVVLKDRIV